jgi:hypothetical protein
MSAIKRQMSVRRKSDSRAPMIALNLGASNDTIRVEVLTNKRR